MAGKGATALIVYNTGAIADGLAFTGKENSPSYPIPVFYVKPVSAKKYFSDEAATVNIKLKAVFADKKRTGHNVAGYIDNGSATTVVFGAHFDHLGYGEDSNSLYRGPERQIHNGADDNASGTAALIELARLLKAGKL
ncbi:MAG: M28 family peptidase, partial [Bacteroidetes bacterium]|nr:M28 family peptidase [Bacteroidota bacterium]